MPWPMKGQTWEYKMYKGRDKGCEFASRRKILAIFWNKGTNDHKVNMTISVKLHVSKPWNAGWWPLVMPKQNSRLELKMTGKLANKWGIHLGRRQRDGSFYFLFCQTYQQLTLKSCATSQRTSYISSQSLQKTFSCTEWKILPRGILDLLSLRAFKSRL